MYTQMFIESYCECDSSVCYAHVNNENLFRMTTDAKDKPKNKFRIPIEISVNDDVNRKRYFFPVFVDYTKNSYRLKATDMEVATPSDMLDKLNEDVTFAFTEYTEGLAAEEKAKKKWEHRKRLDESPPDNPTPAETHLLEEDAKFFYKRYMDRMKSRIKKKETYNKRVKAKETHKTDHDCVERRENWVYKDGLNYNVRWSSLPQ